MDSFFLHFRETFAGVNVKIGKKGKKMEQNNLFKNQNLFPRNTDIPKAYLKDIPCIQTGYLVNGEIQVWDGPRQEVLSPVWVSNDNGLKPFPIGEYPLLTEAEAFQALDAAVAAYDHGRGMWPTLSVAERIEHMERFVFRMIEVKDPGRAIPDVGDRQITSGFE